MPKKNALQGTTTWDPVTKIHITHGAILIEAVLGYYRGCQHCVKGLSVSNRFTGQRRVLARI